MIRMLCQYVRPELSSSPHVRVNEYIPAQSPGDIRIREAIFWLFVGNDGLPVSFRIDLNILLTIFHVLLCQAAG